MMSAFCKLMNVSRQATCRSAGGSAWPQEGAVGIVQDGNMASMATQEMKDAIKKASDEIRRQDHGSDRIRHEHRGS